MRAVSVVDDSSSSGSDAEDGVGQRKGHGASLASRIGRLASWRAHTRRRIANRPMLLVLIGAVLGAAVATAVLAMFGWLSLRTNSAAADSQPVDGRQASVALAAPAPAPVVTEPLPPPVVCPVCPAVTPAVSQQLTPSTPDAWSWSSSLAVSQSALPPPPPGPLPDPLPLASYTVPAAFAHRTFPFPAADESGNGGAKAARGIVVTLFSKNVIFQLQSCWEAADKFFFAPFGIPWLIAYERFPQDATEEIEEFIRRNRLERVDANQRVGGSGEAVRYRAPSGVILYIRGVAMNVPHYLSHNPALLDRPDWMRCANRPWTFNYMFYNTFFVQHMMHFEELDQFDYFMKMDGDILWLSQPPHDPFAWAGAKGCVWGHTQLEPANYIEDCNAGGWDAAHAWANTYGVRAHSERYGWMQRSSPFFYGNMVWGATSWLRSPEVRHMAQYLYESEQHSGYFKRRWGDQAVWPQFIGMFFDIPDLASSPLICDLFAWRKVHFKHQ